MMLAHDSRPVLSRMLVAKYTTLDWIEMCQNQELTRFYRIKVALTRRDFTM
jgi:hypothetical protein